MAILRSTEKRLCKTIELESFEPVLADTVMVELEKSLLPSLKEYIVDTQIDMWKTQFVW